MVAQTVVHTTGINWDTLLVQIGSILGSLIIILGFIVQLKKKVAEVHVLVNARLSTVVDRVAQLADTLDAHGITLPDKPNQNPDSGASR